jgi:D-alanyl-D-alanine endopeptidase (penicillin-binding protein 7)
MTHLRRYRAVIGVIVGLSLIAGAVRTADAAQRRTTRAYRAAREAMTPRFKFDENGALVPDVRAEAAIVFSPDSGKVLWEDNASDQRSIASITKVMTALVYLEDEPDLDEIITVTRPDTRAASTTFLRAGEKLSARNVLHLALIASDNAAARVLARISHGGTAPFVQRMNAKAAELGLDRTFFADPSGLDARNVSSAYDLSRLIVYAAGDERISEIMQKADYQFRTSRRPLTIRNTNKLVGVLDVVGGKTGFISASGHCLVTLLRLPQGPSVAIVVLGAKSNLGRFWETRHLFNWLSAQARSLHLASSHIQTEHPVSFARPWPIARLHIAP